MSYILGSLGSVSTANPRTIMTSAIDMAASIVGAIKGFTASNGPSVDKNAAAALEIEANETRVAVLVVSNAVERGLVPDVSKAATAIRASMSKMESMAVDLAVSPAMRDTARAIVASLRVSGEDIIKKMNSAKAAMQARTGGGGGGGGLPPPSPLPDVGAAGAGEGDSTNTMLTIGAAILVAAGVLFATSKR